MLGYTGHFFISGFGRHDWTHKGLWDCAMGKWDTDTGVGGFAGTSDSESLRRCSNFPEPEVDV